MSDLAGSFDAVLIAGGRSRRFGSDKAFLDWKGAPLYQRQLALLKSLQPDRLWLSANRDQAFPALDGVTIVRDEEPDQGPLGGFISVFRQSSADFILVLGVDLPMMEPSFLSGLIQEKRALVPQSEAFWEPLAALYPRREMLDLFEQSLAQGDRKLQHILNTAEASGLIAARPIDARERLFFTNLNSHRDLPVKTPNRSDDTVAIERYQNGERRPTEDFVAVEEPLEIRVNGQSVAVMMRTPGHDDELVAGFLFTEGLISSAVEIESIESHEDLDRKSQGNTIEVELNSAPDLSSLTRHVFTSSSCGVCGKATIDSVFQSFPPITATIDWTPEIILGFPDKLREAQKTFDKTGGLHASAIFSPSGELQFLREDVGRHNALDKVIGHGLLNDIDLSEHLLLVSGRLSFELTQKALAARISFLAGISAPSSLAVDLARRSGQTLIGFLRDDRFNRY